MKKVTIYILLLFLAGFVFIYLFNPDIEKRCVKTLEKEREEEVKGIVIKKYYVKENMYPYLEIRSCYDSAILKKSFHAEFSGIYDYAEIGDSIYKQEGSLKYTIVRDTIAKNFKFTMFCNE